MTGLDAVFWCALMLHFMWLASDASSFLIGSLVAADGGMTLTLGLLPGPRTSPWGRTVLRQPVEMDSGLPTIAIGVEVAWAEL